MNTIKMLGIVLITFSLSQCGSAKFDKNPPFKVTSATYNNWTGGQPGVSGRKIIVQYNADADIQLDTVYFMNKKTKVELHRKENKTFFIGHFNTSNREKYDLVIDVDTKKEINNKIPKMEKIPFELKEDEAVISYKENGKIKFFKIENVEKTKSAFFQ